MLLTFSGGDNSKDQQLNYFHLPLKRIYLEQRAREKSTELSIISSVKVGDQGNNKYYMS